MDSITKHHYDNIRNNNAVRNSDGSISTVRTVIMGDGEREYLIPTVWDGQILSDEEAFDRAMSSGIKWPSLPSSDVAVGQLEEIDAAIHEGFDPGTTPQEAEDIILRGADYPNSGIVGSLMSPRPPERPQVTLSPTDIEKMERVIWGEARGETPEGRDAIRGVILNRLASGRFGDTIDDVLTASQFNTIKDHGDGDIYGIPVPREDLDRQIAEAADYLMLGEDASGGRSFYQVEDAPGAYEGTDPMTIGEHTFYKGIAGQEPVYDTNFSHNIRLTNDEEYQLADAGFAKGGVALSDATKGIRTREGMDMAMNKFQLDRSKADEDGDGQVSKLEEIKGEAAQRTVGKDDLKGMACGGMMAPEMEIDPVSGNEVPLGSNPENVRDDIPAMLSQDEYVLPAHVVKWHGLKYIQEMQMEAEAGLMGMSFEGLLGGEPMEDEEMEPAEGTEEDLIEDTLEDEYVEDEGVEVEVPTVEVEDELEDEDYEEEPLTSDLPGMVKKQKFAFIVR